MKPLSYVTTHLPRRRVFPQISHTCPVCLCEFPSQTFPRLPSLTAFEWSTPMSATCAPHLKCWVAARSRQCVHHRLLCTRSPGAADMHRAGGPRGRCPDLQLLSLPMLCFSSRGSWSHCNKLGFVWLLKQGMFPPVHPRSLTTHCEPRGHRDVAFPCPATQRP